MKHSLTWTFLIAAICSIPAPAGNQILLRSIDPDDGTPRALAADRGGHLFVISYLKSASGQYFSRVVELDLVGSRLASMDIAQITYPSAAAADEQGNLILSGSAASPSTGSVVVKIDPQLRNILFVRTLPAGIGAVAADANGNIYLTGSTSDPNFPVTADAYQTKPPGAYPIGSPSYAFLTKLSPGGDRLLYSTYFGNDATSCTGGSACIGVFGQTGGTAIAVDASGAVVIGGNTTTYNLPTTADALATNCTCTYRNNTGFVAKFQPGGAQQLLWSTFLTTSSLPPAYEASFTLSSLALDPAGNVIVGGSGPPGLPGTPGSLQPSFDINFNTGFLAKLNSSGTTVIWGTYFGGSRFTRVSALALDAQGQVVFTGVTLNALESTGSLPYVARLTGDGARLVDYYEGPVGQDLVVNSEGRFAALGQSLWIETASPGPSLLGVTNSAGVGYTSSVARYELVTLYGIGLGPATPANGEVRNGAFTSSLAGYQVLVDGVPAPLLYADSTQMNIVIPRAIGARSRVQVVTPAGTVDGPILLVPDLGVPAIFHDSQTGFASAVDQDGSINSDANPAKSGSIVTVFVSGAGANYFADGELVPMGIYNAFGAVWAGNSRSFEVLFAGDAPGLVAGVMQINFRVPDSLPSSGRLSFTVAIGGVSSAQNQIAVVQ